MRSWSALGLAVSLMLGASCAQGQQLYPSSKRPASAPAVPIVREATAPAPTPAPVARSQPAKTTEDWVPTGQSATPSPSSTTAAVSPVAAAGGGAADSDAPTPESDYLIDGVPYAKVLYQEGKVWVRPPGDSSYHRLAENEPVPAQSVVYTGADGTLDLALGPGMALRMVPTTLMVVDSLPQPAPSAAAPPTGTGQVGLKSGTVFSALGRDDGASIDYKVRTPEGVAGARGTMFSTSVEQGQGEVDMLHGTVSFETPDHQTAKIEAGQSQRISGGTNGKFTLGGRQTLNPQRSEIFFNHAGGLLEHASGGGVVRRGLGVDLVRTLQQRGFKLSAALQQRFQNAGRTRQPHRPAFDRSRYSRGAAAGGVRSQHQEDERRTVPTRSQPQGTPEQKRTESERKISPAATTPPKKEVAPTERERDRTPLRDRLRKREQNPDGTDKPGQ